MKLIFEKLKEEELEEVALLYDAERNVITNREKMIKTFNRIKDDEDYYMITAKLDDEVVGFTKAILNHDIFEENNDFITVWSLRVKKEFRRKGIAIRLIKYIEEIATNINCEFICLIAEKNNVSANSLYKKLGYKCENGYVKVLKNKIDKL